MRKPRRCDCSAHYGCPNCGGEGVIGFVPEPDEPEETDEYGDPERADFEANAYFGDLLSRREPRE